MSKPKAKVIVTEEVPPAPQVPDKPGQKPAGPGSGSKRARNRQRSDSKRETEGDKFQQAAKKAALEEIGCLDSTAYDVVKDQRSSSALPLEISTSCIGQAVHSTLRATAAFKNYYHPDPQLPAVGANQPQPNPVPFPAFELYRVGLFVLDQLLVMIHEEYGRQLIDPARDEPPGVKEIAFPAIIASAQLPLPFSRIFKLIGVFEADSRLYVPRVSPDLYAGNRLVPNPASVTIRNLRQVAEFLSGAGNAGQAQRRAFLNMNPIPCLSIGPLYNMTTPVDDVCPQNYGIDNFRQDVTAVSNWVLAKERQRPAWTCGVNPLTSKGSPCQLVTSVGRLSLPTGNSFAVIRGKEAVEGSVELWSPVNLSHPEWVQGTAFTFRDIPTNIRFDSWRPGSRRQCSNHNEQSMLTCFKLVNGGIGL